jgi:hypothetical protein
VSCYITAESVLACEFVLAFPAEVLPPFERFGNRIVSSLVLAPGLPQYRELAHVPGDQWMWVVASTCPPAIWMLPASDAQKLFSPHFEQR